MTTVRRADPRDAEAVADLLVAFRDHLGYERPSANAVLAGVEKLLDDWSTDFLLAFAHDDGPPVGVVQLRFRWGIWRAGFDCLLEDLFVAESARGGGVGRALVEATFERARERGARRIELDVNEANEAALALYGSFGFRTESDSFDGARDLYMRVHIDD